MLIPDDERIVVTIDAVAAELCADGLVRRYRRDSDGSADGLAGREGAFLTCSFWFADALVLIGRHDDAEVLFDHLIGLCNDVDFSQKSTTSPKTVSSTVFLKLSRASGS